MMNWIQPTKEAVKTDHIKEPICTQDQRQDEQNCKGRKAAKNDVREISRDWLMKDIVGHGKEFGNYRGNNGNPFKEINKYDI